MMKRNESFTPNYLSMLDLLSSALAAVILLFVMTPQSKDQTQTLDPTLSKSPQRGEKFLLKNINFYPGSTTLLPDSEDYIKEQLIPYLKKQTRLRFRLIGHSNGVSSRGNAADIKELEDLSLFRARTVARLLSVSGIDESKISYEGRGAREMIDTVIPPGADVNITGGKNRRVELLFE